VKIRFLAGIAALAFSGCSSLIVYHVSDWPQPPAAGATYAFLSLAPEESAYRSLIARELKRKSWKETAQPDATYLVTFFYEITPVNAPTPPYDPNYAPSPVARTTMTNGVLASYGNEDPSHGGARWRTTPVPPAPAPSREPYRCSVDVQILKPPKNALVYSAGASRQSSETNPSMIVPGLLRAALRDFPRE